MSSLPSSGRAVASSLLRLVLRVVPPRRQVLVYGWPDTEGNAISLLRFLARETDERRLVWLTSGEPAALQRSAAWLGHVTVLRKRSAAGLWAYLRSDVVCFTHGLFGSPWPRRGRVYVNLWHGDGPKRTMNPEFAVRPGATAVVAGTRLWGEKKAAELGMAPSTVLVVGNPRIDDLVEPMTCAQRTALADLLGPRFVLWMPTYRDSNGAGFRAWSDARRLSETGGLAALAAVARTAEELGVRVVVKPHPMDRDDYAGVPGLPSLDDGTLEKLGLSIYQVLGAASGLITDYSSVWTDFLATDRPVLLFCPDHEEYRATRGFNVPDLAAVAPGPLATEVGAVQAFVAEIAAGHDPSRDRRHAVAAEIGAVTEIGAARRLWEAVSHLRAAGARPIAVREPVG